MEFLSQWIDAKMFGVSSLNNRVAQLSYLFETLWGLSARIHRYTYSKTHFTKNSVSFASLNKQLLSTYTFVRLLGSLGSYQSTTLWIVAKH